MTHDEVVIALAMLLRKHSTDTSVAIRHWHDPDEGCCVLLNLPAAIALVNALNQKDGYLH